MLIESREQLGAFEKSDFRQKWLIVRRLQQQMLEILQTETVSLRDGGVPGLPVVATA